MYKETLSKTAFFFFFLLFNLSLLLSIFPFTMNAGFLLAFPSTPFLPLLHSHLAFPISPLFLMRSIPVYFLAR